MDFLLKINNESLYLLQYFYKKLTSSTIEERNTFIEKCSKFLGEK